MVRRFVGTLRLPLLPAFASSPASISSTSSPWLAKMQEAGPVGDLASISIQDNVQSVKQRVSAAYEGADPQVRAQRSPRLVAASKTKAPEMIIEAYRAGQRHFGENYVKELQDKSNDPDVLAHCPDISWHFIGTCQTKLAGKVVQSKNITMVETLTSTKLADKLQNACHGAGKRLTVLIQVNTSGEANKNGVEPTDVLDLANHVIEKCPNLKVGGLMTIGALGNSLSTDQEENPDFAELTKCRKHLAQSLGVPERDMELSMGMSNDFEKAIRMGSTNVRVGSLIFGPRSYKKSPQEPKESAGDLSESLQSTKLT